MKKILCAVPFLALIASLLACSLVTPAGPTARPRQTTFPELPPRTATPAPLALSASATPEKPAGDNPGPAGVRITAISANSNRNLAVDEQGRVWSWGTYKLGPVDAKGCTKPDACQKVPTLVPGLDGVVQVSAGYDHNLALKADGTVWAWGRNDWGALGIGSSSHDYRTEPVQISGLNDVTAISASANFSLAVKKDGSVWAWGSNEKGQLGNGKDSYTPDYPLKDETPVQVVGLDHVIAVGTGSAHSLALREDGTVWAWGNNQFGTLGQGTADTEQHPKPAQVPGLANIRLIAAGFENSIAIQADGTYWIWGLNAGNQLALKTMDLNPHPEPQKIPAYQGAVAAGAGTMSSAALTAGGTILLCGIDPAGMSALVPTAVPGLSQVSAISAGESHRLALLQDGTVWAWGENGAGQIGDGTQENRAMPVQVQFAAP